ncbi:Crp/Fnr family transcriptional regulator [Parvicella tangerina]|nr:Crp/Fnr family transcriptional regulator [Parvicella tangerina]
MKDYIESIIGKSLPKEDLAMLHEISSVQEFTKGDSLLEQGQRCTQIWYLSNGAVRFFENVHGEYRTTHFFQAPAMFTVYQSILTGEPSELSIEATTDLKLEVLPYHELKALYERSHSLESVGRIMAEFQFIGEMNRRRMLLNMDALQRYEYLEANQPEVFQLYQLKDIATYIGITPVSLSRLRKYRMERK